MDCFEKFGRTPAAGAATPTTAAPVATAATATGGATQPTSKSGSDGGMITAVSLKSLFLIVLAADGRRTRTFLLDPL